MIGDGATVAVFSGNTVDVNGTLNIAGTGIIDWPDMPPVVGNTPIFTYDMLIGAENLVRWRGTEAQNGVSLVAGTG